MISTRRRLSEGGDDDAHGTTGWRTDAGSGDDAARAGARAAGQAAVAAAPEVAVAGAARAARGDNPWEDRRPGERAGRRHPERAAPGAQVDRGADLDAV